VIHSQVDLIEQIHNKSK